MIGSTLKSKLLRNLGANAYGQLITVFIQLASVPLYLHYWGVELYGEWLILSAIPAYLALSDVGFATVAANDMTMRVARGDKRGALEVYQSIWGFISGISISLGALLTLFIYASSINNRFSITNISEEQTRQLLFILMLYVFVGLQGGVLSAGFRASGRYAYGTTLSNTVRLVEWLASMVALLLGGGVLAVAMFTLIMRITGLLVIWRVLQTQERWLSVGVHAASFQHIKTLLKPAMAFMAFPLGLALSLQGMVLIIGMTLGSAAVVIFSAYRTLTRFVVQVITMLNQAVWPEITAAYGAGNYDLVKQLHRKGSGIAFWISLMAVVVLAAIGEWFISKWTRHAFEQNHVLFILLLGSTFLNVIWQSSWVIMMATNQHTRITNAFLVMAVLTFMLGKVFAQNLGIIGVGVIILLAELPMMYSVINSALQLLNDKWAGYVESIFMLPINYAWRRCHEE